MKFIVNNKIYDTDKAEKVLDYRRRFPLKLTPQFCIWHDMELYRTAKGSWFSLKCEDFDKKDLHRSHSGRSKRNLQEMQQS